VTFAARSSVTEAERRTPFLRSWRSFGCTASAESVLLSVNVRSATETCPCSSVAVIEKRHVPSG
jgi:hypothetical protein